VGRSSYAGYENGALSFRIDADPISSIDSLLIRSPEDCLD
jgi:hypothetical protein